MEKNILNVCDIIGKCGAYEHHARKLLLEIEKHYKNGILELDFKEVELISCAFVGELSYLMSKNNMNNIQVSNLYEIAKKKWHLACKLHDLHYGINKI